MGRGDVLLDRVTDRKELLEIIKKLLKTETNLDFLLALSETDQEALIACLRERLDKT